MCFSEKLSMCFKFSPWRGIRVRNESISMQATRRETSDFLSSSHMVGE